MSVAHHHRSLKHTPPAVVAPATSPSSHPACTIMLAGVSTVYWLGSTAPALGSTARRGLPARSCRMGVGRGGPESHRRRLPPSNRPHCTTALCLTPMVQIKLSPHSPSLPSGEIGPPRCVQRGAGAFIDRHQRRSPVHITHPAPQEYRYSAGNNPHGSRPNRLYRIIGLGRSPATIAPWTQ
jgi:hypothetical protein